jgi:tRNA dimethylallyltransferase
MNWMSGSEGSDRLIIPVLVGATAVGKTSVALELADEFNFEIVSCDSRQIYKYLNVGTAKPTADELRGRPYHLIDLVEPERLYSAVDYRIAARDVIGRIIERGRIPLVAGGTGLYLRALTTGFFTTVAGNASYRSELSLLSSEELHSRLRAVDPDTALEVPVGNRVRMIRALEIYHTTGRTKSDLKRMGTYPADNLQYQVFWLTQDREKLYQFINLRVDKMIGDGLVEEVETLVRSGYGNSPVLSSTVGYREVLEYLNGKITKDQSIQLIKQRTRNYAKRQITWFKKTENSNLIDRDKPDWKEFLFGEIRKLNLDS